MKTEDEFNKVNRQESQEVVGGRLRTKTTLWD